jgi:hypothetical protein
MKYTNYILGGDIINIDQLISEKPILKQLSILLTIPVVILGLVVLASAIPATVAMDGFRDLKMRYYMYMKSYRRYNYYEQALSSLSLDRRNKETIKIMLLRGKFILMDSTMLSVSNAHIPFKMKLQYALVKSSYQFVDQGVFVSKHVGNGVGEVLNVLSRIGHRVAMR